MPHSAHFFFVNPLTLNDPSRKLTLTKEVVYEVWGQINKNRERYRKELE